jgi:hypothetical protein
MKITKKNEGIIQGIPSNTPLAMTKERFFLMFVSILVPMIGYKISVIGKKSNGLSGVMWWGSDLAWQKQAWRRVSGGGNGRFGDLSFTLDP